MHRFSDQEKEFIKEYCVGRTRKDITDKFNEVFDTDLTILQISNFLKRNNLKTGLSGCFQKGNIPHNKGKKMPQEVYVKVQKTMFKKGQLPTNHRIIGSERITKDGYIEVKIAEPDKWELKHIHIWESVNGKKPENSVVIFLDGDNRNFNIDNLKCITRAENLFLNNNKLRFKNAELTASAINVAKINSKVIERSEKNEK